MLWDGRDAETEGETIIRISYETDAIESFESITLAQPAI